jgi:hypothetical protein
LRYIALCATNIETQLARITFRRGPPSSTHFSPLPALEQSLNLHRYCEVLKATTKYQHEQSNSLLENLYFQSGTNWLIWPPAIIKTAFGTIQVQKNEWWGCGIPWSSLFKLLNNSTYSQSTVGYLTCPKSPRIWISYVNIDDYCSPFFLKPIPDM